ncbi:hypothetical protein KQI52_02500 [bacterium]|nr:hypothetical protein [bacterium]
MKFPTRHITRSIAAILIVVAALSAFAKDSEGYNEWKRVDPPAWRDLSSIEFSGDGTGWLYSPESGILYRTDEVQRWIRHEKLGGDWKLVRDGDKLPLFLIGPKGEIRVYLEEQQEWAPVYHGGPAITINDVAALPVAKAEGGSYTWNSYAIIAVGEERYGTRVEPHIIAFQPPARGWREVQIDATSAINTVAVRNPFSVGDRSVFVAADSSIYVSTDDAFSFRKVNTPVYQNDMLRDITFYDRDRGWAVGDDGTLLWTTSGGQSWYDNPRQTRDDFVAIKLLGWTLFVLSDDRHNGGDLWTMSISDDRLKRVDLPHNDTPRSVALDWRGRRWMAGDRGILYIQSKFDDDDRLSEPMRIFPDR